MAVRLPPFQSLMDAHRDDVYRFLVASLGREEADDCFQETFIAALRAYPRLRDASNLRSWLFTIAHRKAIDAHRARSRRATPVEEVPEQPVEPALPNGEPELWRAVRDLPAKQRAAVLHRYVNDLAYVDIGQVMGCSEEAARRSGPRGPEEAEDGVGHMNELEQALRKSGLPAGDPGAGAAAGRFLARAEDEGLVEVAYASLDSPLGELLAAVTPRGLLRLSYDPSRNDDVLADIAAKVSPRVLEAPARLDDVRRQLDEYFEGERRHFGLKLDWSLTRGFFQKILQATARLDYGELATYKQMAEAAGSPRAVRAAGNALGSNPIPIVVPCHRIVRTGGKMGGYGGSLGPYIGGPGIKERLLELEGALDESGRPRLGG